MCQNSAEIKATMDLLLKKGHFQDAIDFAPQNSTTMKFLHFAMIEFQD